MPEEHQNSASDRMYSQIRKLLVHEDLVINNRMVWLGVFQGLLFASLAFAWDKQDSKRLVVIFAVFGMIISVLIVCTLLASTIASWRLLKYWDAHKPSNYEGPDVIGFAPTERNILPMLIAPWNLIPLFFVVAWCGVLWVTLTH
jgi:hypothetical protein